MSEPQDACKHCWHETRLEYISPTDAVNMVRLVCCFCVKVVKEAELHGPFDDMARWRRVNEERGNEHD